MSDPYMGTSADNSTPGLAGENTAGGDGVVGKGRRGVVGMSDDYQGVFGWSRDNAGVVGESQNMHAVFGITHSTFAGVFGASTAQGSGVDDADYEETGNNPLIASTGRTSSAMVVSMWLRSTSGVGSWGAFRA